MEVVDEVNLYSSANPENLLVFYSFCWRVPDIFVQRLRIEGGIEYKRGGLCKGTMPESTYCPFPSNV